MSNYQKNKARIQDEAKEWQLWASEQNLSYGELAVYTNYFYKQAKRYGLIKEFRENAII